MLSKKIANPKGSTLYESINKVFLKYQNYSQGDPSMVSMVRERVEAGGK